MKERDYVDELSLKFELSQVNLKEQYKKATDSEKLELEKVFNNKKELRQQEVLEEIQKNNNSKKKNILYQKFLEKEIEYLKELDIHKQDKKRLGLMILLIIKNLAKKPCFAGYSNNWKDDFYSKGIENCLKYLHNFNEDKISKRTGQKIKAFAYITQIVYMSFISVINERKQEEDKINKLNTNLNNSDNYPKQNTRSSKFDFELILKIDTDILEKVKETIETINEFKKLKDQKQIIELELFSYNSEYINDQSLKEYLEELSLKHNNILDYLNKIKSKLGISYLPQTLIIKTESNDFNKTELLELTNKNNLNLVIETSVKKKQVKK